MQHVYEDCGTRLDLGDVVRVFFTRRNGTIDYETGCVVKCEEHENFGGCIRMDRWLPESADILRIDIHSDHERATDKKPA